MSSLKLKTARGSLIYAAISFGFRPIGIVLTIVLARLLTPADFGQVGMTMILLSMANIITEVGMQPAIVQTSEDINKVAHYAFATNVIIGVSVTVLIVIFADFFARVLGGGEQMVQIIRWMSIYITAGAMLPVPQGLLQRELKFKEIGLSQVPAEFTTTGGAILLAWAGFGVWSLVIGYLAGQLLRVILIWAYCRPWIWLKPQRWESDVLHKTMRYGLVSGVGTSVNLVKDQIDTWYVGRTLGMAQAGLYGKAYSLTSTIVMMLTASIFGYVLFPSYSRMKDDIPRLTRAYLKSTEMVFLVIAPVSIGLAIVAPLLVSVLFGEQWLAMIPAWQILSLYGLLLPISVNSSPIFLAVGQPKRNLSASIVLLSIMVPLLIILTEPYGISGAAIALSVASLVAMLFNVYQVEQILPGTAGKTFRRSLPFFVSGGLMSLGVVLSKDAIIAITRGPNILSLVLTIGVGAILYIALVLLLQRDLILELYELMVVVLRLDARWPGLLPEYLRASNKARDSE